MITSVKSLKQYQSYCARLSSDTKNKVNDGDEEVKFFSNVWKYYLIKLAIKYFCLSSDTKNEINKDDDEKLSMLTFGWFTCSHT